LGDAPRDRAAIVRFVTENDLQHRVLGTDFGEM
jgi:hypothetical protein